MISWEVTEAKKAAKVFRSFNIKCRVVVCKHYSSYLRVYDDDDASDDYSERYNKARTRCNKLGIEAWY